MTTLPPIADIVNKTPANADPVELAFNLIEQHINTEIIERDGSVVMRTAIRLANSEPVSPLEAASKGYTDSRRPITNVVSDQSFYDGPGWGDPTAGSLGPTITLTTGSLIRITWGAMMRSFVDGRVSFMSYDISGATTDPPPHTPNQFVTTNSNVASWRFSQNLVVVTPGVNTITAKYAVFVVGSPGEYFDQLLVVERMN